MFGFLQGPSALTEVTRVVALDLDPGAEMNVIEVSEDVCAGIGEHGLQFEDCRSSSVSLETALGSLDNKVLKHGEPCRFTVSKMIRDSVFSVQMKWSPKSFTSSNSPSHIPRAGG